MYHYRDKKVVGVFVRFSCAANRKNTTKVIDLYDSLKLKNAACAPALLLTVTQSGSAPHVKM
jgi:hypothetical protein